MIIAAIYPVFLWFMVFRFRRTWIGAALAIAGTMLVWPVARFVPAVSGTATGYVFAKIVYGEMAVIGLVAAWLATMRRPPANPICPYCRYDLTGLPVEPGTVCPECGNVLKPSPDDPTEPYCLCCGHKLKSLDPSLHDQTCPACGAGEVDFGNWTKAKALREQAEAERAQAADRYWWEKKKHPPQGRSTR